MDKCSEPQGLGPAGDSKGGPMQSCTTDIRSNTPSIVKTSKPSTATTKP